MLADDNTAGMVRNGGAVRGASRTQLLAFTMPMFMLVVGEDTRNERGGDGNRYRRCEGGW
jgi:hypothetical protein